MSTIAHDHPMERLSARRRVAATLGLVGGTLGLAAGLVELTAGPSIRAWVGNKHDTTRLGLATLALAAIALAAAVALLRRHGAPAPTRLGLAVGLLVPGLICFTTVGRLWYLPGALLVTAGFLVLVDLRKDVSHVAASVERNATAVLVILLGSFYVFLGATALGVAGTLGISGGLLAIGLIACRATIPAPAAIALLVLAALPFAALTWWSLATPLIALLLVGIGVPALRAGHAADPLSPGTGSGPLSLR